MSSVSPHPPLSLTELRLRAAREATAGHDVRHVIWTFAKPVLIEYRVTGTVQVLEGKLFVSLPYTQKKRCFNLKSLKFSHHHDLNIELHISRSKNSIFQRFSPFRLFRYDLSPFTPGSPAHHCPPRYNLRHRLRCHGQLDIRH
jgi:hypothetical protein